MREALFGDRKQYEGEMDELRALAAWIVNADWTGAQPLGTDWQEYLFSLIYRYSELFSRDIVARNVVSNQTLNLFQSALQTTKLNLGITESAVQTAHKDQIFESSGFWWEMRRFLGRFPEMAEEIAHDGVTQLVCAGISGCVIGEFLGRHLEAQGYPLAIDHMVFKRQ